MRRIMAGDDVARLARSAERLVRLAQAINERAKEWEEPAIADPLPPMRSVAAGAEQLIQSAREAIRADRSRPDFGAPALFQTRPWPLMLELFIADCSDIDTSVKVACLSLGGSQTSALRCILDLERLGVVESRADPSDGRRRLLSLSQCARRDLQEYLTSCSVEGSRPIHVALRMRTRTSPGSDRTSLTCSATCAEITPTSARSEVGTELVSQ